MWLNIFAHEQHNHETLYSAHVCAAKEDHDAGGMQSRPPETWKQLREALRDAGVEEKVLGELKAWLDEDTLRPVQVEVTVEQVSRLGILIEKPN